MREKSGLLDRKKCILDKVKQMFYNVRHKRSEDRRSDHGAEG